jgi:hypothetical protein
MGSPLLISLTGMATSGAVGIAAQVDNSGPNTSLAVVIAAVIGAAALIFTSRTMPAKLERLRVEFVEVRTLVKGMADRANEDRRQVDTRIHAVNRDTDRKIAALRAETKDDIDEVKQMLRRIEDKL